MASTPLVKRPVDSTTISAPTEAQLISAGSLGDVVDGDELDVLVVKRGAHNVATDAAEAVDANLNGHSSSDGVFEIAAVQERVTAAGKQKMLGVAEKKVNAGKELI